MIYVSTRDDDGVSVINGATNKKFKDIELASDPDYIVVNPKTNTVYVTSNLNSTVFVINGTSNQKIQDIPAISGTKELVVNPMGNIVYVSHDYGSYGSISSYRCQNK